MSCSTRSLDCIIATDLTFYAGDPNFLSAEGYNKKFEAFLLSERVDQLTARVALHAQLRKAFLDPHVQERLRPFLDAGEAIDVYVDDPRARAKFFFKKRRALLRAVLASEEHRRLREAHGVLVAWERGVIAPESTGQGQTGQEHELRHSQTSPTRLPGKDTNPSRDDEFSRLLEEARSKTFPFRGITPDSGVGGGSGRARDETHAELRAKASHLREELERGTALARVERLIRAEEATYRDFGIDRLLSLVSRADAALGAVNEVSSDAELRGLSASDEYVLSRRLAPCSLPRIAQACYTNYASTPGRRVPGEEILARDREVFCYWLLACLTADCPEIGPNTIIGKSSVAFEDYKRCFLPRKTAYVPSINASHRTIFASKVAERRGLPHIVALVPCTYSYHENNDSNSVKTGTIDLVIYDTTNEKVLLMVVNPTSGHQPSKDFLKAQEERYRLAAVLRSALLSDNQFHRFQCSGIVSEFFFDPAQGSEENFYCIMAPLQLRAKSRTTYNVPLNAFHSFMRCPPRYFMLGSNKGIHSAVESNFYPPSFAYIGLNEAAMHLVDVVPVDYVEENILPRLVSAHEAEKQQSEEGRSDNMHSSELLAPTARLSEESALLMHADGEEEEDPLSKEIPRDVLNGLRDCLLERRREWKSPVLVEERARNAELKALPAVKDGRMRTPLEVFDSLLTGKYGFEVAKAASGLGSNHAIRLSQLSDISTNRMKHSKADQKVANMVHL
ncbi:unnamed protein product [Phytomonas sp. EM1]|nr:unnamed protein product [Phytomonas sp. EM1]|eukprot:CCW62191.1 unnamed protein product [Phytomonas sp. isolate EM1]